ncbi:MMPL family transporter [Acidocella aromatica]|uniref:Putative exporter n=1 Tax=Acidocella aromatica TaxID=1303579 RepID=A0A840VRE2_9PROT|nr:MMPL family transporter [Acidocella aromatica]MBB5373930.1 putative exporter [Acidocella aromatica]
MRPERLALGLWLALLVLCGVIDARSDYRTQMGDFLPHSASLAQQVLAGQVNGGAASHILLVSLKGAPTATLAALSEDLAGRLRQKGAFIDVMNGDDQSLAPVQDFVWRNRYLLSDGVTPARFTVEGLHTALTSDIGLLGTDLAPVLGQSLPADPTGEALNLMSALAPANTGPAINDGVWTSPSGDAALLFLHSAAAGFDLDAQQRDLGLIDTAFAAARAETPGSQAASLEVSGPGVFGVRTRDVTKHDVTRLSILATIGAVSLLAFAYRSPRVLLLGLLPIASGALAAIAAVSLSFGFVHGITLGFGVTLIGEAMDYAIYLFTQTAQGDTARDTLTRIWPTLRLGALTSVAGFAAMLGSSFTGFAQLGLFSIVGLIAAAAVTRFVLPPLVPKQFFAVGAGSIAKPLGWLIRHRRPARGVAVTALVAALAALLSHRGGMWDENLLDLSPIPAAAQALDTKLRHELGVPDQRYFAVFQAPSAQQALAKSEALAPVLAGLKSAGLLGGYDLPSTILPSDTTQRARQAALPNEATLTARLAQAQAGLPFRADAFAPFLKDVTAARTAPLLNAANLPPALALRFGSMLVQNGADWVVTAPLSGVTDPAKVAQHLSGSRADFVDLDHESATLMSTFQHEAVTLAIVGSLAILALLVVGLRSFRRAARVALPLIAAVTITAALLTLGGGKLSIFMVTGFLLIVAIGSNYCLFFERAEPGPPAWERAIASIVLANLCTVAAYGLMALSRIPVLHDIGVTVATGTFLSLVCGAVLSLPGKGRAP